MENSRKIFSTLIDKSKTLKETLIIKDGKRRSNKSKNNNRVGNVMATQKYSEGERMNKSEEGNNNKVESKRILSYSDIEYLCKNVKAKKNIHWILSLRNERSICTSLRKNAHPPNFFNDDMIKWQKRFETVNKLRKEERNKIKNSFQFEDSFSSAKKQNSSSFYIIDSILLKGNTSTVHLS